MVLYGYMVNVVHGTMIKRETTLSEFLVYFVVSCLCLSVVRHLTLFVCIMVCGSFVFLLYERANVNERVCMHVCVCAFCLSYFFVCIKLVVRSGKTSPVQNDL